ncbi:hypothetical protein JCM10908_007110 [Rhodotorula pacifica]|uniref:uncharacterized protein n=1 Tax=Rhodotorula pacifica TaxID=1495444 RepID=UPI00317D1A5D
MHHVELSSLSSRSFLPKYRAHLIKAQYLYADQVLLSSPHTLARRTKLPIHECQALLKQLARAVLALDSDSDSEAQRDRSVADLTGASGTPPCAFTTGDPELDLFFDAYPPSPSLSPSSASSGRGIRLGHLLELAGQSSSGKTNLCLQLACTVQLPPSLGGAHGGALYISSEGGGAIPSRRLVQLAKYWSETVNAASEAEDGRTTTTRDFLDNVHVETAPDAETLMALLAYHVPAAIERIAALASSSPSSSSSASPSRTRPLPIRLLILDSIAAPFRSAHSNGSTGFAQRAKEFVQIGDELKALAARYRIAVVVVNQVADVWDAMGREREMPRSFMQEEEEHEQDGEEGVGGEERAGEREKAHLASHTTTAGVPVASTDNGGGSLTVPVRTTSTSTTSSTSHSNGNNNNGNGLPPAPHRQYSFPSLLYSRFQSPHLTGSFSSLSHPTLLPLPFSSQQQPVAAALGHTWSQIPTTRVLCLVRRGEGKMRTRRCMTNVWSPFAPRACVEYEIDEEKGIRAVGEVRVRAVPGWESYDADAEEGEDEAEVETSPTKNGREEDVGEVRVKPEDDDKEEDEEKQYWGSSTEDLLLLPDF